MKMSFDGLTIGKKLGLGVLLNAAIIAVIVVLVFRSFASVSSATTYQTEVFAGYQRVLDRLVARHWRIRSGIQYLRTLESSEPLVSQLADLDRDVSQSRELLRDLNDSKYERIHPLRFKVPESYRISAASLDALTAAKLDPDIIESLRTLLDEQPKTAKSFAFSLRTLPSPPKDDDQLALVMDNSAAEFTMTGATAYLERRFDLLLEIAQVTELSMQKKLGALASREEVQSSHEDALAQVNRLQTPDDIALFEKLRDVSASVYVATSPTSVVALLRDFNRTVKRLEKALPASSGPTLQRARDEFKAIAGLVSTGLKAENDLRELGQRLKVSHSLADDTLRRMDRVLRSERDALSVSLLDRISRFLGIVAGLGAFGVVLSLIVGWITRRAIVRPLQVVVNAANRLAARDLKDNFTLDAIAKGKDEVAQLGAGFVAMSTALRQMIGQLQDGVGELSTNSSQIAGTSQQTAALAAQQAATVSQISATTEQMRQTAKATVFNARAVVSASEEASGRGVAGVEETGEVADAIGALVAQVDEIATRILHLSEQTSRINAIVNQVNDIAEQSNLLAVNASIEASKAGDRGRGFGVVATEIRKLAEESKRSTSQIRGILEDIEKATAHSIMVTEEATKRAASSREKVAQLRGVIEQLANALDANSEMAQQIAAAANQNASGIEDVAQAMESVQQASGEGAKGAKQLEHSVASIAGLVHKLEATTAQYAI